MDIDANILAALEKRQVWLLTYLHPPGTAYVNSIFNPLKKEKENTMLRAKDFNPHEIYLYDQCLFYIYCYTQPYTHFLP